MKTVFTSKAPTVVGPYSQAIVSGGFVFCSGQIGINPISGTIEAADIEGQTEQVISNLKAVLEEAGSSLSDVVQTQCFLSDLSNYAKFNEVYAKYLGDSKPARYTVGVVSLPLNALVEIAATAEIDIAASKV